MNSSVVRYQRIILHSLQAKHVYAGTVRGHVKARRRKQNKAARIARRANRGQR